MTNLYTYILGFGLLLSSILSISSTNPVISVIFLISTFVCSAGYLILLGVKFIGISYIVIYVGAIAVLFLFVIMMININITDIIETGYNYTKNFPLSIIIISLFIFIFKDILYVIFFGFEPIPSLNSFPLNWDFNLYTLSYFNHLNLDYSLLYNLTYSDLIFTNFEQIQILGHNLYTYGAILLIILSIILLLAMLAAIIISKENNQKI